MATLSAPQLVNLRTTAHRSSFYLSVFQPATLLAAQVNNGSIARGARSIAYDSGSGSGFATIEGYQLLEVDTATGTEYVRVKSITGNQTSGTITVDENAINWGDNNPIRIKHFYPMVAVPPSIRSGIFYKFYDTVYSTQNSTPNPVTIIGSHLVGVLTAGSVAFSLNSSSSYAIAQGATISSRVWSCVHNGGGTTGISFSSTTAANPTLTITAAGQYWLKCVVTDSNSKTQATYRAVFVYANLNDAYIDFTVQSLSGDWSLGGWQASVEVTGNVALSDFPDGALAVIHYKNYFDATEGYVDLWGTAGQNIVLSGYIRRDQDNDNFDEGTGKVNFDITTPDGVMDNMSELGSISLNAISSPSKWYQYASWLTVGRGVHHLLKWHSSVLETCDVLGLTDNTLGVKNTDFTEPSVLQMINGLGFQRGHFAKMASSRLGRLYFVTDSQMLNTAARAALDTVFTLATSDISGVVDVVRQPEAVAGVADLDGFSFDGATSTPFISIMPGYRESLISYGLPGFRGTSPISTKSQVLNNQTDSNEKVGRVFAQANNNPLEMRFSTPANYLGAFDIVPSIGWYNWGIADADLKRNTELNGRLLLCRNTTHQIDVQNGTVQTSVVFEPEAHGPDGIQGNYPVGYPAPSLRPPSWTPSAGGAIYGYIGGGDDLAVKYITTDRITFATSVTAANADSDLTYARGGLAGVSDCSTYGYWAGGLNDVGSTTPYCDRITFLTGVTAEAVASYLPGARGYVAGLSDGATYGYWAGGLTGPLDTSDKITFATGVVAANTGNVLSVARDALAAISDGATYGYFAGGMTAVIPSSATAVADRITFATSAIAANAVSNLSSDRAYLTGLSDNSTYGYFAGGDNDAAATVATADRITFASGVTAANPTSDLSSARSGPTGASSGATYGYFAGGYNAGALVTTDRITFATGATAANAGSNLSTGRGYCGGLSDGSF